jgi:hypothetical protein
MAPLSAAVDLLAASSDTFSFNSASSRLKAPLMSRIVNFWHSPNWPLRWRSAAHALVVVVGGLSTWPREGCICGHSPKKRKILKMP